MFLRAAPRQRIIFDVAFLPSKEISQINNTSHSDIISEAEKGLLRYSVSTESVLNLVPRFPVMYVCGSRKELLACSNSNSNSNNSSRMVNLLLLRIGGTQLT